jgi:hypothetical protein
MGPQPVPGKGLTLLSLLGNQRAAQLDPPQNLMTLPKKLIVPGKLLRQDVL